MKKKLVSTLALSVALAGSSMLHAQRSGEMSSKSLVTYGVRTENGEPWAYIEDNTGVEYVATPYQILRDGFTDRGASLPGRAGGLPVLSGSGSFREGTTFKLSLTGALPGADATLFVGSKSIFKPFMGGTLVPDPESMIALKTDASGALSYTLSVPLGTPSNTDMFFQVWVQDPAGIRGYSASNSLQGNDTLVGQTVEDPSRMRVMGLTESRLATLADPKADVLAALLQGPMAAQASKLWQGDFPGFKGTPEEADVLSRLSQHLDFFVHKSEAFDPDTGWTANGCSNSPDFNFTSCCDTHDQCYCTGGNEAARLKCDQALKTCITGKGHPYLAKIYYRAVRKFGKKHFNYTC